ncbi:MAG: hypothetical protein ACYC99_13785, partial [Candidatus Geothermincolia bacterium]
SARDEATLASHTCARSAVHHAAAFCEAVEDAQGIEVPDSHAAMRVVLSEWTRIASHLEVVSDIARALEDDIVYGRPRRYIAAIRSALESACTNPFGFGAVVPGGVDIGGEVSSLDALGDLAKTLARDCGFWEGKLRMSGPRLTTAGIGKADLPENHAPAPAFRASGSRADLRAGDDVRGYYAELGYRPVTRVGGTALDRVRVLLGEIVSSIGLIEKARGAASGCGAPPAIEPGGKGSSSGAWESPHGAIEYRVLMGSEGRIMRVRVSSAVSAVAGLVGPALEGAAFEDAPASLVSLNLCDRCVTA